MYRILIVEDDKGITEGISDMLTMWGMEPLVVRDFRNVTGEFAEFSPHLVLLDISLPFYNGYHWCDELRKVSKVPIIFISSASDRLNMLMAMNMGADDFVAKPFDTEVLMAKIHAILRRTYDFAAGNTILEHRGAMLNTGDGTFVYNGEKIDLSPNEYRILLLLMSNKEKVVSREKLMETLWQSDDFVDENTLTVNINRLRKKLTSAGLDKFIETKFGAGYLIR